MMKRKTVTSSCWAILIATSVAILSAQSSFAEEAIAVEKPRMLMVTQSAGYRHGPVTREGDQLISPAEKAMKKIAARTELFEVDFTQDVATHLTRENLQNYDLVAFYTSGKLPIAPDDLKYLLEDWVRQPGHGFLGFHSASDTLKEHEPYWDFIGGTFDGHPWGQNTKVTITVHDTAHPAMKPFGEEIELTEEIYQYVNWQPEKVRVLMSLDMAKTDTKMPYHVPVAWVKQVGEGRMYYNNLGHRNDTWENEQFLKSIEGAVRWMQGKEEGDATPNPELSREQHRLSVEAAKAAGITVESIEQARRDQEARNAANQARKKAAEEKQKKAEADKKPLKVFILSGQSNMQGHAKISTFDYLGDDPATVPMLNEMRDSDGKPRLVKDTWISYLTQGRGAPSGEGFGQLTAGYGARTDPAKPDDKIGPEFTFGIYMQKSLNQPILIIKTAWGGKSLHTDFRPPSAGPYEFNDSELESIKKRGLNLDEEKAKRNEQSGVYYRLMIDHVNTVLKDIKRVCPDYDEKQGYEIAGFVWFQGWNDVVNGGVYPQRGQKGGYDKYSQWMAQFIRDVRKDLNTPDMPFVIGVLGVNGPVDNIEKRYQAIHGTFREAMAAPASLAEFKGNVLAVETAPYWDMPLDEIEKKRGGLNGRKRTLESQIKKGELTKEQATEELAKIEAELNAPEIKDQWNRGASNAGYHYYGCGKTMALIGKAFAEGILKLNQAKE